MVQGKVEICGVNTAKLPLLKQQEKEALFVRIKEGDMEAREEFIKGNYNILDIEIEQISIKACTNEGLDAIGEGKAVKATTIVLIKRNVKQLLIVAKQKHVLTVNIFALNVEPVVLRIISG